MKKRSIIQKLKSWYSTFTYNYAWSDWVFYIDGRIPKFSLLIPLLGYLILFNDQVSDYFVFENITANVSSKWGLSSIQRLRFIYFGLVFLAVSNFIYRIKRPYQFRFGTNLVEYTKTALQIFTFSDYLQIHGRIRDEGHLTLSGKYYDSEWDGFKEAATNTDEGRDTVQRDGNWESAKAQYGNLLLDILRENFFRNDIQRRFWLSVCIFLSSVGYFCLLAPSIDLFIKVTVAAL